MPLNATRGGVLGSGGEGQLLFKFKTPILLQQGWRNTLHTHTHGTVGHEVRGDKGRSKRVQGQPACSCTHGPGAAPPRRAHTPPCHAPHAVRMHTHTRTRACTPSIRAQGGRSHTRVTAPRHARHAT